MFNSRQFYNVNRASVLTPQVRAIWDTICASVWPWSMPTASANT